MHRLRYKNTDQKIATKRRAGTNSDEGRRMPHHKQSSHPEVEDDLNIVPAVLHSSEAAVDARALDEVDAAPCRKPIVSINGRDVREDREIDRAA